MKKVNIEKGIIFIFGGLIILVIVLSMYQGSKIASLQQRIDTMCLGQNKNFTYGIYNKNYTDMLKCCWENNECEWIILARRGEPLSKRIVNNNDFNISLGA